MKKINELKDRMKKNKTTNMTNHKDLEKSEVMSWIFKNLSVEDVENILEVMKLDEISDLKEIYQIYKTDNFYFSPIPNYPKCLSKMSKIPQNLRNR